MTLGLTYDSLCVTLAVSFSLILQQPTEFGPIAMWLAESNDNDDIDRLLGLGAIAFDNRGNFIHATNANFAIVRHNGAENPLLAMFDFSSLTALDDSPSELLAVPDHGDDAADFNGNDYVGIEDLLFLLANWG